MISHLMISVLIFTFIFVIMKSSHKNDNKTKTFSLGSLYYNIFFNILIFQVCVAIFESIWWCYSHNF